MPDILFVCTGNTCRSSMAAAIAVRLAKEQGLNIKITSAGIAAREGDPAATAAIEAAAEMGIDLGTHRTRMFDEVMAAAADTILTMTAAHKEYIRQNYPAAGPKTFTLKEYVWEEGTTPGGRSSGAADDLDIPDPIGRPVEFYRATARELAELVAKALEKYRRQQT